MERLHGQQTYLTTIDNQHNAYQNNESKIVEIFSMF